MMRTLSVLAFVPIVACASDDGAPPVVADLVAAPLTVTVGTATVVSGTLSFTDPDGDPDQIGAAISFGSTRTEAGPAPIQIVGDDRDEGTVQWAMSVTAPAPGDYTIELWVIDEAGNESNVLSTVLTAQ